MEERSIIKIKTLEEIKDEIFKDPTIDFEGIVIMGDEFEEWLKEQKKDSVEENHYERYINDN